MNQGTLREQTRGKDFESIHIELFVAISEMNNGRRLVSELISVYLEQATQMMKSAGFSLRQGNFVNFQRTLLKLAEGSERVGALRLADRIEGLLKAEETMTINNMQVVMAVVSNEFERMSTELALVNSLIWENMN